MGKKSDTTPVVATPISAEDTLGYAIASFFDTHPLYYYMLSSLVRVKASSVPTMGVGFDTNKVASLFYNPEFVKSLSGLELSVVLNHECQHLGLKHLQRFGAGYEQKLANIAMDILINSNIPEFAKAPKLREMCMTQDKFESLQGVNLRDMTWEEVYGLIKSERDKAKQDFQDMMDKMGGMDSHEMWGDGEGQGEGKSGLSPMEQAALDDVLKGAVKKLGGRDPGNVPGAMRREIEKILKSRYDWRKALNIFAQSVAMEERTPTWKRPSRRFGVISPGQKKDFRPRLLCVVDNSGSISEAIYGLFMAQLIKISDICQEVAVIGCDTRVNFEGKIEKGVAPKLKDMQSGGGTEFQPAFDYAQKNKFDGVVYFTDGYCFDRWVSHGIPTIFALCSDAREIEGFRNIHIEETE